MADIRLIPDGIRDESNIALNECIERAFNYDLSSLLVNHIDSVDSSILPYLASEAHIAENEGWSLALTDEQKRNLIKNSDELHSYKGTKYALKKVLETLILQGKIQEWYEYSGQRFHFKLLIDILDRGIDENTLFQLEKLIEEYKNKRSKLDGITLNLINKSAVPSINTTILSGEEITVYPWNISEISASGGLYFGIGTQSVESVTVYPQ